MCLIMGLSLLFGCYLGASILLFKFPTIIHKKKVLKFKCKHISHRGGAGENYENTMTAFRRAVELGTDMIELDCHLTQDGRVVVAHDANLKTRTGLEGKISEKDYSDLPPLMERLPIDFVPGVSFKGESDDRKFPLLEEVFHAFPDIPINVDIKENNDILISKVSDLCKKYNREHLTVWGNVKDAVTQKCFKQNPEICLLFSLRRTLVLLGLLYTGLLPFIPLKETHLEIFIPSQTFKLFNSVSWWQSVAAKIADILLIRKCLFQHLSRRGIQTYLWVLNTEEEYRMAFDSGVTGVMTDYPTKLKHFLETNPKYNN